jgi:hypothetical protein
MGFFLLLLPAGASRFFMQNLIYRQKKARLCRKSVEQDQISPMRVNLAREMM